MSEPFESLRPLPMFVLDVMRKVPKEKADWQCCARRSLYLQGSGLLASLRPLCLA